ncbi:hypothetical protein [Deinococcus ruber]|uniref:Uncharacterized protein n=1 Tax=Deinococcus ruber TaxID=1848197 RepID=A0A918CEJ6_9DEIO|nr:hypothetical protein [Deinococcus ruber]GGR17239.1 hypothetical protein GCM10008957_32320 [Deinococcus ruber]
MPNLGGSLMVKTLPASDSHPQRSGPPVQQSFTVQQGMAVIATLHGYSVVIPTHGTWPGPLEDALSRHVQAAEVFLTPNALYRAATEQEQQQGVALVTAQALSSVGTLHERTLLLDRLSGPMNQTTRALCVGSTRTAVNKAEKSPRRNRAQLSGLPRSERRPRTPLVRPVVFNCEKLCITRALLLRLDAPAANTQPGTH